MIHQNPEHVTRYELS